MSSSGGKTPKALGIIAGSGAMPISVAEAARNDGRHVHIVALEGVASESVEAFSHTWVRFGEIGKVIKALKRERCEGLVIVGGVRRPKVADIRLDLGGIVNLPSLLGWTVGGDNSALAGIVGFFESKGFEVLGAHDVNPDLLANEGPLGRHQPSKQDQQDIAIACRVVKALGALDVGQAAVVARQYVLAVEAAEGTDRMLERCKDLNHWWGGRKSSRSGVLVKCAKPGQERRVDLPTIGPETVRCAADAGLAGIGVAALDVLILNKSELIEEADRAGLFVVGVRIADSDDAQS
ncbi:MAG: LpxI family protein [Methyloligellaceae bacterium]